MRILAIETSCDETALALVEASGGLKAPRFRVLENIVSSQIAVHAPFGGVVPGLAKREHIKNLPVVFAKLSKKLKAYAPDLLAVTVGPGLEPALWTGIVFAKEIHKTYFPKVPLIGANHLEGHLASFLLPGTQGERIYRTKGLPAVFPAVALVVSGGHTILLYMKSLTAWRKLGETRDDAVGEAFDKAAKMLGLPYPGGPEIARAAETGNPAAIPFPRPMLHAKNYDFSFSGLKTSLLYHLRDHGKPSAQERADIAASFQEAAVDVLVQKAVRAAEQYRAKSILLSGGVAANRALRAALQAAARKHKLNFLAPPMEFNTDNATMIAAAAYLQSLRKKRHRLAAQGNLSL